MECRGHAARAAIACIGLVGWFCDWLPGITEESQPLVAQRGIQE